MSAANSAAIKRRAGNVDTPKTNTHTPPPPPSPANTGLTIHQVVNLFDKRLNVLEKTVADFIKSYTEDTSTSEDVVGHSSVTEETMQAMADSSKEMIDEFGARFEILAEEIDSMKNTVMTLQTYTLTVNKMLLESNGKFRNIPNIAMNK